MRYRSTRPYAFKLSVQMVIFGLWIMFFAFFVLYFSIQMMSAMSTFDAGVLGSEAGMNLEGMLVDGVVMLYRGGFLTLGIGGVLMAFGSMFIISVIR